MRKFKRRTISRTVLRTKRRRPGFAKCAVCKKPLHGVKRLHQIEMKNLSKTEKRPERPYGGYLCAKCAKELFREKVRGMR